MYLGTSGLGALVSIRGSNTHSQRPTRLKLISYRNYYIDIWIVLLFFRLRGEDPAGLFSDGEQP